MFSRQKILGNNNWNLLRVSIHSSPSPVCAPTPSSTPPPSTPTHAPTPVTDDWAIKTMLKLFPTVPRKEIKIGQRISEGHFCVIHRAIWRDSAVAIKSMQIEATHLEIFLNEAAVLWRLRMSGHLFKSMPLHICNFHGLYSGKQNQIGIVMEYMNLGSLAAFFHEQKVSTNIVRELQPKDLIRIAVQACTGLLQLQTLLIMHGNISARNFLLSGDPFRPEKLVVKLADFGLAQMLSHKDEVYIYWDGERKGWPFKWMAPETFVVSGEEQENFEFSLYSDIWSFGVFLLELFTQCSNPYENLEPSEVRSMLMVDPKMNPLNYNNELFNATFPRDLKRIVRKCFGIMPKDRPKSEKLLKMLQQIAF